MYQVAIENQFTYAGVQGSANCCPWVKSVLLPSFVNKAMPILLHIVCGSLILYLKW